MYEHYLIFVFVFSIAGKTVKIKSCKSISIKIMYATP